MKRVASFLFNLALFKSVVFARPFGNIGIRDINICNFISDVAINATGAAGADNTLVVSLDNNWQDITNVGNDPELSISSVAWPGFPAVNCDFKGIDTAPVLSNGVITDSAVIFQVSPPQTLTAARCSCEN